MEMPATRLPNVLCGEADDDGHHARAREKGRPHRPQGGDEVRIQNENHHPDQHRAELLQEIDRGAVNMSLARHRRMHRGAESARDQQCQHQENHEIDERAPHRVRFEERQQVVLADFDVVHRETL